jgi:hypothetical protein
MVIKVHCLHSYTLRVCIYEGGIRRKSGAMNVYWFDRLSRFMLQASHQIPDGEKCSTTTQSLCSHQDLGFMG